MAVRALSGSDSALREALPTFCNEKWFIKSFCKGIPLPDSLRTSIMDYIEEQEKKDYSEPLNLARVPEQIRKDLWAHVKTLNLYDCMNVLCSVPSLRRKFFKSFERDIGGVVHSVIGVDAHDACVPNPASVREYLSEMLLKGIAAYRPNDGAAYPLVLVSDPGQDLDDEMAFIMLRTLELNGWFRLEALVTNLHPADERARLAHGTLVELGWSQKQADRIVAVGTDGGSRVHNASAFSSRGSNDKCPTVARGEANKDTNAMLAESYMPPSPPTQNGQQKLLEVYESAKDKSVVMVLISSLMDAALFLRNNEELFLRKTKLVSIMGGKFAFLKIHTLLQFVD
jgi:hypothetical protein